MQWRSKEVTEAQIYSVAELSAVADCVAAKGKR
jgi:hypothetical protein